MSYSYIIQKDLPLISWKLDGTGITSGNSIAQDGYLSTFPNTATTTNGVFKATCTEKKLSIVNGSPRSVYVTQNGTDSSAIQVPAMGFATNKFKANPMTLEFWIKPKTTLSSSTMQKIVGKPSSQTGVYVHNSSFIGMVGDTAGNIAKVVIPVENMSKPFHVAFVYQENSVTLIVNGIGKTKQFENDILSTSAYSISSDVFRFYHFGLDYAVDNISIYAYPMSVLTARRHMVYGLGYQIPESVASEFGGYRYNISLAQTKLSGNIQKHNSSSWLYGAELNNLAIENGHLRINSFDEPTKKNAADKTSSIFSYHATQGLKITSDGGYIEIFPQRYGSYVKTGPLDDNPNGSGMSCVFNKSTSENVSAGEIETLMILQDPIKEEYSLKIYLHGESGGDEAIYYQINNESPVKLGNNITGGINTSFAVGYFYNSDTNEISIFQQVNGETQAVETEENNSIFPISYSTRLRLMSNDIFDEYDSVSGMSDIERFNGGLLRVVQLDTNVSSVYSDTMSRIDKYTAVYSYSEKRFIVKASGWIKFKIDAKRIDSLNGIIGPNRIEWGHDSDEVSVVASPIGTITSPGGFASYSELDTQYSTYTQIDNAYSLFTQIYSGPDNEWFTEENIVNRAAIKQIMGKESKNTRAILITMNFDSNDVVENPTIVSYFRFSSIPVVEADGVYTSTITSIGPDINVTFSDGKKDLHLPDYRDTPFLWTEELGGLRVSRTAKIEYDLAPTSGDEDSGIIGLTFMLNIPDTTSRKILSVTDGTTTSDVTFSGNTVYITNGSIYVNGTTTSSITPGVWHNIIVTFDTRKYVGESTNVDIVFGDESLKSDFYIDEIMTFDGSAGSVSTSGDSLVSVFYNLYKGTYTSQISEASSNELIFYDSEIKNSTEIYQPMAVPTTHTALLEDVDLASYSNKTVTGTTGNLTITYTGVISMLLDGTYMQDGDRVLLKNQSTSSQNGIFLVSFTYDSDDVSKINTINLTRQTNPSTGSLVYVKDGVVNKGTHWVSTTGNTVWAKSPYLKKVDAYTFEGSADKTDIVAKATITI